MASRLVGGGYGDIWNTMRVDGHTLYNGVPLSQSELTNFVGYYLLTPLSLSLSRCLLVNVTLIIPLSI